MPRRATPQCAKTHHNAPHRHRDTSAGSRGIPWALNNGAALEYAIRNQRDRRNLTGAEILRCVQVLDKRASHGGDRKSDAIKASAEALILDDAPASEPPTNGKSAEQTAALLGVSRATVERARTVNDHAPEPVRQAVENGDMSLRKAAEETQKARRGVGAANRQRTASVEAPDEKLVGGPELGIVGLQVYLLAGGVDASSQALEVGGGGASFGIISFDIIKAAEVSRSRPARTVSFLVAEKGPAPTVIGGFLRDEKGGAMGFHVHRTLAAYRALWRWWVALIDKALRWLAARGR